MKSHGLLLILLLSSVSWAHGVMPSCPFHQTVQNTLMFKRVQVVRRNEGVGLHQEEDLLLKEWIGISDNATLGIDKKGRVLSVLKLSDRTVAKPLSGKRQFQHLFLSKNDALIAVTKSGEIFRYQHEKWAANPTRKIAQLALQLFGAVTCANTTAALLLSMWMHVPSSTLLAPGILVPMGLSVTMSGGTAAFFALWQYEASNDFPDGFVKIGEVGRDSRVSDFKMDQDGWVDDYTLRTSTGSISLKEALADEDLSSTHHFDVRCEDELLARGVPEREYTSF